ncbi:alpha-amylase family glycosyl hydrolase [Deinococcus peraridilitoris]|uniref:alpha-amylase n=1 Tax=Deinococcus peraridilitoris (strain DSM 19664 / LMG 22246 / CIP 109416 / KR-200) TaxID=937777 RepID=L0A102_DEIPD|nr:alpha-amylase family glycosyl hydrolase [Deinococcus peraridilitoris]AFZ66862.1 glycosidase [Deinococcus peraridilitoris DSM 19664]
MIKRTSAALLTLALVLTACGSNSGSEAPSLTPQAISGSNIDSWRRQIIYLTLPDRFFNGSTANDNAGQPYCFDPSWPYKFHGGDLAGLRQKLSYIKSTGALTLWTTPVYAQVPEVNPNTSNASCGYHGYWPNFKNPADLAVEPKLGSSSDLHGLITDLHNNGMKYMMDMVANHAGYGASVTKTNPGWFHGDCTGDDINCPLAGLPDFRQEDGTVATYLTNLSKNWTSTYAIDAIRMDTAKHVPMSYWQNSWIPGVLNARPNTFLLAEAFLTGGASQLKPYYDAGFDSTFNFPLRSALVSSVAKAGSMDTLASSVQDYMGTLGLSRALLTVNLLDNHDVPRFLNESGFGVSEDEIRRRYHMALGALMTLPGIPQLYYGNEIAMYGGNDPDNRRDMPSWAWTSSGRSGTYSGFLPNPGLTYNLVQKLAGVRTNNPGLWKGYYAEMWRPNGGSNLFAFYRGYSDSTVGSRLIMVFNNNASSASVTLNIGANTAISSADRSYLASRTFDDQAGQGAPATVSSSNGSLTVSLPTKSFAIYKAR